MTEPLYTTEAVIQRTPFVVRRVVRWAECDPAGVVYAGQFPDYMLGACHLFRQLILGSAWNHRGERKEYDAPGKAINIVFMGPLWPGDAFDMTVYVGGIRKHTTDLLVHAARVDDSTPVFVGRVSSIYVAGDNRKQAVPVPEQIRAALESYRAVVSEIPGILDQVLR